MKKRKCKKKRVNKRKTKIIMGGYECIRYVVPKESDVDGVDFIMLSTDIKTD